MRGWSVRINLEWRGGNRPLWCCGNLPFDLVRYGGFATLYLVWWSGNVPFHVVGCGWGLATWWSFGDRCIHIHILIRVRVRVRIHIHIHIHMLLLLILSLLLLDFTACASTGRYFAYPEKYANIFVPHSNVRVYLKDAWFVRHWRFTNFLSVESECNIDPPILYFVKQSFAAHNISPIRHGPCSFTRVKLFVKILNVYLK